MGTIHSRVNPARQDIWGWPAIANFTLGGMAAGYYLLNVLIVGSSVGFSGVSQPAPFKLIAPTLMALGFSALTIEAGRPLRSCYLLNRLVRSWMSREVLMGSVFIAAAFFDQFFPNPFSTALGAMAATGLLLCQGFLVFRARAMVAWNVPLLPLQFLASGLATGSGLLLVMIPWSTPDFANWAAAAVLSCVIFDMAIWHLYLNRVHDPEFSAATMALRSTRAMIANFGLGRILPGALLIPFLIDAYLYRINLSEYRNPLGVCAGLMIMIGGVLQKIEVLRCAGLFRGGPEI